MVMRRIRVWNWVATMALVVLAVCFTLLLAATAGVDVRWELILLAVALGALWFSAEAALAGSIVAIVAYRLIAAITVGAPPLDRAAWVDIAAFLLVSWVLTAIVASMRERGRLPQLVHFDLEQRHGERALAALAGPILWLRPTWESRDSIGNFVIRRVCESPGRGEEDSGGLRPREGQFLDEFIPQVRESGCLAALAQALQSNKPAQFEIALNRSGSVHIYEMHAVPEERELVVGWRDLSEERAVQRQLRLNEWRYRSLVQATSAIVWTTPASGEIETEQQEWSAFTGQSFEEQKGWGWIKAVHPEDREKTAREWSQAVQKASLYEVEHRLRSRSGEYRMMAARAVPILGEQGELLEWVGVHTDITERKRAEERVADRERFFRQLIEGLPHFTWTCDNEGRFDYITQRWARYSGSETRDPIGSGSPSHVHPDDQEAVRQAWRLAVAKGQEFHVEMRLRRKDGAYRWFEAHASPVQDASGSVTKWFGCSIDIDDRKRAEDALRRSETRLRSVIGSLEQRVRDRTLELESRSEQLHRVALDLAEAESRERNRLAKLLHDHFQQLVSAAKLKVGFVRRRTAASQDVESLRQIESLLEESINASRSLATELSPPILHDGGLAAGLEWLKRRMEHNHALSVLLEVQGECEPDNEQVRVLMFECVRELLFNVTKHAGTNCATVRVDMLSEGLLHIQVADEGKGFDAVQEEVRRRHEGSLGLFSIRERLSLVGGLMRITSSPGHGTCVDLTVPCALRRPVAAQEVVQNTSPVALPAGVPRLRIVVADDHKLYREGLVAVLVQEPALEVVAQAADGQEALDACRRHRPDVLIVDLTMPKLNGVQVTATLSHEMPTMQIIGLSMHHADDMASAMLSAGAAAYFSKDESAEETLLARLRSLSAAREPQPAGEEKAVAQPL